ncbi:ABC transporter permease [Shewanella sp. KX20019]|uniref:ABC transporter permease n=1 Tax=Shewanella sp. KX20019 TaxID=2803864 RepID=UPI00192801FE|nr:ABC transporter permease [Shewanella sp. KX20019]QQX80490.1 ABC transporter permease [Shewanella sp. KX20019]
MLNNYLVTALRAFRRQKQHVLLNLFGLSIGLAAAILVALFVNFERSFDQFQPQHENTYRVSQYFYPIAATAPVSSPLLEKFTGNISDITAVFTLTILNGLTDDQVTIKGEYVKLEDMYSATPNLLDFIDIQVLDGSLQAGLTQPDRLIVTQTEALRLFGRTDVVGDTLQRQEGHWTIAAVIADLPDNSHFAFRSLAQMTPEMLSKLSLSSNNSYNYLRLREGADRALVANKLTEMLNEMAYESQEVVKVTLQPLAQIHLTSHTRFELKEGGSESTVLICIGLSILLIVIVSVNFINMSIAQASQRAKEVGVRKALGASKTQLVSQFLTESILLSTIAAVIACAIVELSLPWFNTLVGRELSLNYASSFSGFIAAITVLVGLVAGLYPALFISSFSAKRVLSGDLQRGKTAIWVRKSLLVLQSALSISLIISSITLYQQLDLLNTLPLGYEKQHKMLISGLDRDELFFVNNSALLSEIKRIPGVNSVSAIDNDLTEVIRSSIRFTWDGSSEEGEVIPFVGAGFDIVETHGFNLIAGRDFSADFAADWFQKHEDGSSSASILITRQLAKLAGFSNPQDAVGQTFGFNQADKGKVVGVIEDLKVGSVKDASLPVIVICGMSYQNEARLVINFEPLQYAAVKAEAETILQRQMNKAISEVELLANNYDEIYQPERQVTQVVMIFSMLAILLTCVGILGLASFSALRRSKEVAIRKVLGDTVFGLVNLLAKEFLLLVLLSAVVAFPVTYWLVDDWLNNFNERVSQSILAYGLAVTLVTVITWLTVASIAYKVASARPSLKLRYE